MASIIFLLFVPYLVSPVFLSQSRRLWRGDTDGGGGCWRSTKALTDHTYKKRCPRPPRATSAKQITCPAAGGRHLFSSPAASLTGPGVGGFTRGERLHNATEARDLPSANCTGEVCVMRADLSEGTWICIFFFLPSPPLVLFSLL